MKKRKKRYIIIGFVFYIIIGQQGVLIAAMQTIFPPEKSTVTSIAPLTKPIIDESGRIQPQTATSYTVATNTADPQTTYCSYITRLNLVALTQLADKEIQRGDAVDLWKQTNDLSTFT